MCGLPVSPRSYVRASESTQSFYRMIAAHRQRGPHGGSLLDMMLAASPDQIA